MLQLMKHYLTCLAADTSTRHLHTCLLERAHRQDSALANRKWNEMGKDQSSWTGILTVASSGGFGDGGTYAHMMVGFMRYTQSRRSRT